MNAGVIETTGWKVFFFKSSMGFWSRWIMFLPGPICQGLPIFYLSVFVWQEGNMKNGFPTDGGLKYSYVLV